MNRPHLLVGDSAGNIIEVPDIYMAGMNLVKPVLPGEDELISFLPENLELTPLPGRVAIGYDPDLEKFVQLREYDGKSVFPVAAVLPTNHLQILRSAFSMILDAPRLPNQNFTAAGGLNGQYFAAALNVTDDLFEKYNILQLDPLRDSLPEMSETGLLHLSNQDDAIVDLIISEGVDLEAVTAFIQMIREQTVQGTIQVTTAIPDPSSIKKWCEAGLDSIRINMNSAQKIYYDFFHAAEGVAFNDVVESFKIVQHFHRRSILNYGTFPGLTDHPDEVSALKKLVGDLKIETLQLHNLNIDPEWYMDELRLLNSRREQIGMQSWFIKLKKVFPGIQIGFQGKSHEAILQ